MKGALHAPGGGEHPYCQDMGNSKSGGLCNQTTLLLHQGTDPIVLLVLHKFIVSSKRYKGCLIWSLLRASYIGGAPICTKLDFFPVKLPYINLIIRPALEPRWKEGSFPLLQQSAQRADAGM